ncbi:MFS amine transporter [Penicillium malachiteum]|uniref:MFS amine transporter n=1 Tax=Penicillium malachiteum TaxID=1324776 RepID=UPI002546DCF9|nr:MFS amine transporter [Penicillium malachiteum]KAJ5736426.1 MFS amine transporter [Penicillium malachiteum]
MPQSGWRSSTNFVILVVCVAVFTDVFLYGLIVPVMPFTLSRRVGIPDEDVQQWTSALLATYGAAIILGSLLFGWLGDKTETRQTPFIIGLVILGGGTLLFSLTDSLSLIVIARILQGCSTAIVFTIGYSLMLDTVGNEGIGHAVGFTSMSMSLGLFGGPIIGGLCI